METKTCKNINIFSSKLQYEQNIDNINANDINLIRDDTQYATLAELNALKEVVKNLQMQIAAK